MTPRLSGLAIHWNDEVSAEALAASWPEDDRFELLVVDNASRRPLALERGRVIEPGLNTGFGGGVNLGATQARGEFLLILNVDLLVSAGALESLLAGFDAHPEAAGLAPALLDPDGSPQASWQLRALPRFRDLLGQCLFLDRRPPLPAPMAGARIPQPAASALALRRAAFEQLGGLDARFWPAWFGDVDLGARLWAEDLPVLFWPESRFAHRQGGTVEGLGFDRFLPIYYRNLRRYGVKHFGGCRRLAGLLALGCVLRALWLPVRPARRAQSRGDALRALAHCGRDAVGSLWSGTP